MYGFFHYITLKEITKDRLHCFKVCFKICFTPQPLINSLNNTLTVKGRQGTRKTWSGAVQVPLP